MAWAGTQIPRQQRPPPAGGPRGALVFLGLATTLAIIDATIVNVALPSISADIGLTLTAGEWVVSGYGLTLASLLISFGRLADRLGQRRVLIVGVIAFAATSLICALAPNSAVLIVGRLLQGAAAAAVLPTVQSLINSLFRGPALVAAFAVYGATIGTAAALGPLVGSALVDWFGWPSAFLINLPLAAIVVVGVLRTVPAIPGRGGGDGADPIGQLLLLVGLAGLVYGLVEAPRAGWFPPTADAALGPIDWGIDAPVSIGFASLLIGVVVLVIFVVVERARGAAGKPTLVDLTLFSIPSFSSGSLAVLVVALGEFGILFLLPLYLQVGRGSVAAAGAVGGAADRPRLVHLRAAHRHPQDRAGPDLGAARARRSRWSGSSCWRWRSVRQPRCCGWRCRCWSTAPASALRSAS